MIELLAIAGRSTHQALPEDDIERTLLNPYLSRYAHRKIHRSRNLMMMIVGDRPVSDSFYTSPAVTLVCHCDIVEPVLPGVPDAALLAQLYEKHGDSFVRLLRGWFAILLYDHKSDELKIWTDHFGVRRIIYEETQAALAAASDIRMMLPWRRKSPDIDLNAILEYLLYTCIPAPHTIYRGIKRLPPGHGLSSPTAKALAYWDMSYPEDARPRLSETDWAAAVESGIRHAVQRHLNGSAPPNRPGCFLSGGTDSSSVAGLVGQITSRPPSTFSIGFDDPRYNEISYARTAAAAFAADHHEYFVTPDDILELIPKAVEAYDEPFGNSSIIPSFYCARLAAQSGITHLLAGDGGDELFGGNERYASDVVFQRYQTIPRMMRTGFVEPLLHRGVLRSRIGIVDKLARYIGRANMAVPDRYFSYALLSTTPPSELFSPDFCSVVKTFDALTLARSHFRSAPAKSDLNRWLYLDLKMTITDNDLRKVTPMTEFAGVLPRYPLLDPDLAEFSGRIPVALKVKGSELRYIFKKGMAGLLPPAILKKKKHGFGLPFSVWLGEHARLREFTFDVLNSQRCRERGYFRKGLTEWLWQQYNSVHRSFYGDVLWLFLMLELWHTQQTVLSASRHQSRPVGNSVPD